LFIGELVLTYLDEKDRVDSSSRPIIAHLKEDCTGRYEDEAKEKVPEGDGGSIRV